jgi:predicted transcriptional regulator YheO
VDSFVIQWHYPIFKANYALNPDKLKRQNTNKSIDDKRLLTEMGSKDWVANQLVKHLAEKLSVSERTCYKYIERLTKAGKILKENGLYTANQAEF